MVTNLPVEAHLAKPVVGVADPGSVRPHRGRLQRHGFSNEADAKPVAGVGAGMVVAVGEGESGATWNAQIDAAGRVTGTWRQAWSGMSGSLTGTR